MKNRYIVQFEIFSLDSDSLNEDENINRVQKWIDTIQKYNHSVLWAENPMSNPIINTDNTVAMKSLT